MTMHQAKGREFKVVFLTGDDANISQSLAALLLQSTGSSSGNRSFQEAVYGAQVRRQRVAKDARAYLQYHYNIPSGPRTQLLLSIPGVSLADSFRACFAPPAVLPILHTRNS